MNALHRDSKNRRILSIEALESRRLFDAHSEVLVDLSYRPERNESAISENGIFFVRDDSRYGAELWATNATGDSPRIVVDLTPGTQGSQISAVTAVEGGVYFINSLDNNRKQLWWSDGTESNTRLVVDYIALLEQNTVTRESNNPLPSNGSSVYFLRRSVNGNVTSLLSGLWAASDDGNLVQLLTSNDSFAEDTQDGWRLHAVDSFQQTDAGWGVFIISASRSLSGTSAEQRQFFGITDGTIDGTQLSDYPVLPLASIREAVVLSEDKIMFRETSRSNHTRVLTIDLQGNIDQLVESLSGVPIDFEKSGSSWFFSTSSQHRPVLFRTDGTPEGTSIVTSAGSVHSDPVALSDGSILTLTGESYYIRDFQVTNPETLETTALDFILRSEDHVTRELYGPIVVSENKFFYVETKGNNARRLMMADTQSQTVTIVLDGVSNSAISEPILRDDNLFFTHVAPERSELIRYNITTNTSVTLASIATDGWLGLSIDSVGDDSLVGFMHDVDHSSIFKLRFTDSQLDIVSLVDDGNSTGDLYADLIRGSTNGPHWRLDTTSIVFSSNIVINEQQALAQYFAYDTSASGLTQLVPAALPQPSRLQYGQLYSEDDQPIYRAGGKVVYHAGYQVQRDDGSVRHEIWSMQDGGPANLLFDTQSTGINGVGNVIPMGVIDDRYYFLATGTTTSLYRTNADATAVELVTEVSWTGDTFRFDNYKLLYRPSTPHDPQRILFRRWDNASDVVAWEITGSPPTITRITGFSLYAPPAYTNTLDKLLYQSNGATVLKGTEDRGPLVEVLSLTNASERMEPFFSEGVSLTLAQQASAKLYRLSGAWVGVVSESDETYSFWSRMDNSTGATRVSEVDLSLYKVSPWSISLLDFAMTSDAVLFTAHSKLIRVDRDGTHSFVDVPYTGPFDFYDAKSRMVKTNGLRDDSILGVGTSIVTSGVYSLNADGQSIREVLVADDKHGVVYEQIHDDSARYVLNGPWPYTHPTKITRTLQDRIEVEASLDQSDSTLLLTENRIVLQSGDVTLHDSSVSELHHLNIQASEPNATIMIDIGAATSLSRFPIHGVSLTLAANSRIRLDGATNTNIIYELDDDVLKISIGDLTLRVLNPRDVIVEDCIVAGDRSWIFSPGNDDVEIRPGGTNETELIEHIRNVSVRVVEPVASEGESPDSNVARWRINTKTGVDKLTVAPSLSATALLSVVAELDSDSDLRLDLPPVSGPLDVTRQNGRTFSQTSVAQIQVQLDNTRRPENNLVNHNDANNDGAVTPLDALRILNTLASRQRVGESSADVIFGDTNGDGQVTPLDALLVLNHIARQNRI